MGKFKDRIVPARVASTLNTPGWWLTRSFSFPGFVVRCGASLSVQRRLNHVSLSELPRSASGLPGARSAASRKLTGDTITTPARPGTQYPEHMPKATSSTSTVRPALRRNQVGAITVSGLCYAYSPMPPCSSLGLSLMSQAEACMFSVLLSRPPKY